MGKAITRQVYNDVKAGKKVALSQTSIKRIQKSKSYADFKRILVKDRGPQYDTRRAGRVQPSVTTSTPVQTPQKRSLWKRFLNFFDVAL